MRKAKKGIVLVAVLILASSTAMANGLNLNGFGARAAAMGGAFVGLADDYTAVFWNPAGLALLGKKTFGLAADAIVPKAEYGIPLADFSMQTKSKIYPAGLAGYFHPVSDTLVVGVGVYTPSGLGTHWESTGFEQVSIFPASSDDFIPAVGSYNWESFIGAITIAPSVAFKLSDYVMVGATFNINYGFFKLERWGETIYDLYNLGQVILDLKGWGFGATFGLLVKPSDMVSFGATCRIPSKITLNGTVNVENVNLLGLPNESGTDMDVTYPLWLAGGLAVKPVPNLTLTFDAQYTNWKEIDELPLEFADAAWQAAPLPEGMQKLILNWRDKIQWRGGAELVFGDFAIRGGYYYDPTPTPDETLNILVPGFDFNNFTFGVGYHKGNLNLDFGFEYLMGKKREIPVGEDYSMPGVYEMYVLVPQVSLSFGW